MSNVSEFHNLCNKVHGRSEEVNPKVHLCEIGHSTELVFHEQTGGEIDVYHEGEFGAEANFETNIRDVEFRDSELHIDGVDGHFAQEGMPKRHHRGVDVTISRNGNVEAKNQVF